MSPISLFAKTVLPAPMNVILLGELLISYLSGDLRILDTAPRKNWHRGGVRVSLCWLSGLLEEHVRFFVYFLLVDTLGSAPSSIIPSRATFVIRRTSAR